MLRRFHRNGRCKRRWRAKKTYRSEPASLSLRYLTTTVTELSSYLDALYDKTRQDTTRQGYGAMDVCVSCPACSNQPRLETSQQAGAGRTKDSCY